ncbi:unnamed protein product [Oikopleura dioica]|uniref:Uncharacterized protein n=1 Tax=Oikopleura dioica TaxID=34765 RepID=E4Y830_OIKDI|nr:unnamed protein product [Oikopleura dioica]
MVLSKLKPKEFDRLSFMTGRKFEEWKKASLVDISSGEGLEWKVYWVVPDKKDWGIGQVFNVENRSNALSSLSNGQQNFLLAEFSARTGEPNVFLFHRRIPWAELLEVLEAWAVMSYVHIKGKKITFKAPALLPLWYEEGHAHAQTMAVEDFVPRYRRTKNDKAGRKAMTPLILAVNTLRPYSVDTENAQWFATCCSAEKWFMVDSSGKFLHKAPSMKHNPNPAQVEKLAKEWHELQLHATPSFPADKLDTYVLDLFGYKEIEEAATDAVEWYADDATLSNQYRVLAAKILVKLPKPFSLEDDEKVLEGILRNRRIVKIGSQIPFNQVNEKYPELVRLVELDEENYWEKLTKFCRFAFHYVHEYSASLARNNNRTIPSELLFLLEKPEHMICFDDEQVPQRFDLPNSVITDLSKEEDEECIWFFFKAKNLLLALIPKYLGIEKAPAAKRLLAQMLSISAQDEQVQHLSTKIDEAVQSGEDLTFSTAWKEVRDYVERSRQGDAENIRIFDFAAKKLYSTLIIENVQRILSRFDTTKINETLYRFARTFGTSRVSFFRDEKNPPPAWPFTSKIPTAQQWPRISPNREEIFKQDIPLDREDRPQVCVMKHCKRVVSELVLCGFCLSALTDICREGTFSAMAPAFGEKEKMTPAFERWDQKVGWANATVRDRIRLLREVALLMAVENDDDVSYNPTAPEPVVKSLMAAVGTGTKLLWQDSQIRINTGLLHAAEFLWLKEPSIQRSKKWMRVQQQAEGAAIFIVVDNPGFTRQYPEVIITGRTAGGDLLLDDERAKQSQDRLARVLRRQRDRIKTILEERLPVEGDSCPEIAKLTQMQIENPLVKIVLIAKNFNIFNRWMDFVKDAAGEEELGLTLLIQERLEENSPPVLRWATAYSTWSTLRPLLGRGINRKMPPSVAQEPIMWSFMLDAIVDTDKKRAFCPENLLGSVVPEFNRDSNLENVRRQKKALDVAYAIEGWVGLKAQNAMELLDYDFKSQVSPDGEGLQITPEDILSMFRRGKHGWAMQEAYQKKIFGRMTNTPFTANLGPYNARNWFKKDQTRVAEKAEKVIGELVAAAICPSFDGLTSDDVEALNTIRRPYDPHVRAGTMAGLEVVEEVEEDYPAEWRNTFQAQQEEDNLTEEEEFFMFLPRRFHDQVDWEVEAQRREHNAERRLLHPEILRAMSDFNFIEAAGASIHPRFRGWMTFFKSAQPDWHAKQEPFGVPTLKLLEEFSNRIDFHTSTIDLANKVKNLTLKAGKKKIKKGRKIEARKWSDNRIGALLPKVPKAIWQQRNCFYVPVQDEPWPEHAKQGDSENIGNTGKFAPRPWADLLNECFEEKYSNMFKLGILKENVNTVEVVEARESLVHLLLGKPGPVTQYLGEISNDTIKPSTAEWSQRIRACNIRKVIYAELEDTEMLGSVVCWSANFYPRNTDEF